MITLTDWINERIISNRVVSQIPESQPVDIQGVISLLQSAHDILGYPNKEHEAKSYVNSAYEKLEQTGNPNAGMLRQLLSTWGVQSPKHLIKVAIDSLVNPVALTRER